MTPTKTCPVCGATFSRPERCDNAEWEARKTCGGMCARRYAGGKNAVWTQAQMEAADRMRADGQSWSEIWTEIGGGRSSPPAMRASFSAWAKAGRIKRSYDCEYNQPERDGMSAMAAERWLSLPEPRLRRLMRCEPTQVLERLSGWQDL